MTNSDLRQRAESAGRLMDHEFVAVVPVLVRYKVRKGKRRLTAARKRILRQMRRAA